MAAASVLMLVVTACSSTKQVRDPDASAPVASHSTMASPGDHTGGSMMPLPAGSEKLKTRIVSPASGMVLTGNALPIKVAFSGFTPSCDLAGKPLKDGTGHYHVLLDKSLVDMFCKPTASISMQNVKPGPHELAVVPALNDHVEVMANEKIINFTYKPTKPMPVITPRQATGAPSIEIVSPKSGVTLTGPFTLTVKVNNFENACGLLGKPGVDGYGHWHVNVDSMDGPMMGMMTMLGMSCTNTFTTTTAGLSAGHHTIYALLTDNGHAPLDVFSKIDITVA